MHPVAAAVCGSVPSLTNSHRSLLAEYRRPKSWAAVYFTKHSKRVVAIATQLDTGEWALLNLDNPAPVLCDVPPSIFGADYVIAPIVEPAKRFRLRLPTRVGLVKYTLGMTGLLPLTGRGLYRELTK